MTNVTTETVQEAWIAYLKSQPTITNLLSNGGANEIRESQWQGNDFQYPAIRIYIDEHPNVVGCSPSDIEVYIDVFSEQKSSKEAQHIAGALETLLQKKQFTQNGLKFPMVWVKNIIHPKRDIYAWRSCLEIKALVN